MKFLAVTSLLAVLPTVSMAACPSGTFSRGEVSGVERCALKGSYLNTQLVLTNENIYTLEGGVFFGGDNKDNAVLRIAPGTKILGNRESYLVIMRGSQIYAEGTEQAPIVFTSIQETPARGNWGGIVLNGNAPINACRTNASFCEAVSEGITLLPVKFGGTNPADNSGALKYVRVEYVGFPVSQDNELNGITFNAVGNGTTVEHIQVHMSSDDGIEFFGGTVNAKYVLLTGNEDDSLDWDFGWNGKIQFLIVDQGSDKVDNGIEADNLASPMNATPRSNPEISNMTLIGSPTSGYGMLLRRGTSANLKNVVITGFGKGCIDIDDAETFNNGAALNNGALAATGLLMTTSMVSCKKNFELENGDLWSTEQWFLGQEGNKVGDAQLKGYLPEATSPVLGAGLTPDDAFFEFVDFMGAIGTVDWTAGWSRK